MCIYSTCTYMYVYMKIHVYSMLATCKLVVKEEKKENPDPIHHIRTVQTYTCMYMYRTCTNENNIRVHVL